MRALKNERYARLAIGIDARESAREIRKFPKYLQKLRNSGAQTQVVFLTADDEIILRRYSETRRLHPVTGDNLTLADAIAHEHTLLKPIADLADVTLDTSHLNLHELREEIRARLPEAAAGQLAVVLQSFGFKNGLPDGADFVFDVRCLPNPHWENTLREHDGRNPRVAEYLERQPKVRQMVRDINGFLGEWLPHYREQDRAYVTIAIGCTGGRHRSVYIVEKLAASLRGRFDPVIVKHQELS